MLLECRILGLQYCTTVHKKSKCCFIEGFADSICYMLLSFFTTLEKEKMFSLPQVRGLFFVRTYRERNYRC